MVALGQLFAAGAAIVISAVGILALLAPAFSSRQYGVPAQDLAALAYVRGCGVRDLTLGLAVGALVLQHSQALASVLAIIGVAAAGDFVIVWRSRPSWSLLLHGSGFVGLWLSAWLVGTGH